MIKRATLLVLALALACAPAGAARAEGLADLAERVGVRPEPTDYVLLVDTSLSMQEDGRWGEVRAALSGLAGQLKADDHVSLVTFDDGARQVWQGAAPTPETLLAQLPAAPRGQQTDIGAAIELGVTALVRPEARTVAAVVLITDGELDAAPTSRFPTATAPAWVDLQERAESAVAGRQVGAFALSVGGRTDAALLTKVFPAASVATPDDVAGYLSGLTSELTKVRVAEVLAPDLDSPVSLTIGEATQQGDGLTATATFTSKAGLLPLTLSGAMLSPQPEGAALTLEPASLTLEPGATATARVTVTGLKEAGSLTFGTTLGSPWAAELATAGVELPAGPVLSEPVAFTPQQTPSATASPTATEPAADPLTGSPGAEPMVAGARPGWLLPAALGASLALVGLLWLGYRLVSARLPQLSGSLAIEHEDVVHDELLLTGRSVRTSRGDTRLRAVARDDASIAVAGTHAGRKFTGTLSDGDTLELGDGAVLRFTGRRTRMLAMLTGAPEAQTSATAASEV